MGAGGIRYRHNQGPRLVTRGESRACRTVGFTPTPSSSHKEAQGVHHSPQAVCPPKGDLSTALVLGSL